MAVSTDIHQHLWPAEFLDALRRRTREPYLDGWTLYTATELPYELNPAHHDPVARLGTDEDLQQIVLSFSSPVGIEDLPAAEAQPLLDAWHDGVTALGGRYRGWAAVARVDADLTGLKHLLQTGFAGLQVPATWLATPTDLEQLGPVLQLCQDVGAPVFVHPGPATVKATQAWWPAVVDYPTQLLAAWWAWHAVGRSILPDLRICFAAGAGLAPAHAERYAARSGQAFGLDRQAFVDTSSYGPRGLDSLIRVLGIDAVVHGSDRPYADPTDPNAGPEATHAIRVTNPHRLLTGVRL
jgi:predicted TIM-barrel fold metal-dependent hydrolase